jgi:ankyrin repeat protein
LLTSIAEKREDCALALIAGGADVRSRTLEGKTALHMAAAMSLSRVVDMALSTSPELVNSADAEGFTPLMLAAWAGNEGNVQSMLRHGAVSSIKNSDGKTAADFARTRGHDALAEMLSGATFQ